MCVVPDNGRGWAGPLMKHSPPFPSLALAAAGGHAAAVAA